MGGARRERIDDGAVIGSVDWHEVRYGPNPESAAIMFGIELVAEARRHPVFELRPRGATVTGSALASGPR